MKMDIRYWQLLRGWIAVLVYRLADEGEGTTQWLVNIGRHRPLRYPLELKVWCFSIQIVAWHAKVFPKKNVAYWVRHGEQVTVPSSAVVERDGMVWWK